MTVLYEDEVRALRPIISEADKARGMPQEKGNSRVIRF